MRTFSKKKKLPRLLTFCGAVAVSALLGGCGQSGVHGGIFSIGRIIIPEVSVRIREIRGGFFSFITSGLFHVTLSSFA